MVSWTDLQACEGNLQELNYAEKALREGLDTVKDSLSEHDIKKINESLFYIMLVRRGLEFAIQEMQLFSK